jgi:ribosome recycling factor
MTDRNTIRFGIKNKVMKANNFFIVKSLQVFSRRGYSLSSAISTPVFSRFLPVFASNQLQLREYHASVISLAKKGGGKDKGKGSKDDDNSAPVVLPDLKTFDKTMENTVNWFTSEMSKLKVSGRVGVDLFSNLPVESYGTVGKAGQVTMKTPTKLVIALYDPAIGTAVCDALRNCGLGINPSVEGTTVTATIPKPSQESRDLMLKSASRAAEKARLDIRNVRKNANDSFKSYKGKVSEDDIKRLTKEVSSMNLSP